MVDSAQIVVLVFGILICALSTWGIYTPEKLMTLVQDTLARNWGISFAIIVRAVLGWALLVAADESRFVQTFVVLGWLAIIAAIVLVFLGRDRLQPILSWFNRLPRTLIRLWLLFGMAFGGFLVYGVA